MARGRDPISPLVLILGLGVVCSIAPTLNAQTASGNADLTHGPYLLDIVPFTGAHAIAQDQLGFMWFGGKSGLARYDGYSLTRYTHDPEDPRSLGPGQVRRMLVDREGVLWLAMASGLDRYDRATDSFDHFVNDPNDDASLPGNHVEELLEDRSGRLWVATRSGFAFLDRDSETFTRMPYGDTILNGLRQKSASALLEDRDGYLWFGTFGGGLNRFDPSTWTFTDLFRRGGQTPFTLSSDTVDALWQSRDGTIWIGTYNGVDRYDPASGSISRLDGTEGLAVLDILEDRRSALWFTGYYWTNRVGGLFLYDRDGSGPASQLYESSILRGRDVGFHGYRIFEDRSGLIWVGTYRGGVIELTWTGPKFTAYAVQPDNPATFGLRFIQSVVESRVDPAFVWIGSELEGLVKLDRASGQVEEYPLVSTDWGAQSLDFVFSVLEDRNNHLWATTRTNGVFKFDPVNGNVINYRHDPEDPESISSDWILSSEETSDGFLWFGPEGGVLNRFDPETGSFKHFSNAPNDFHIYDIEASADGTLWLGSAGLVQFDPVTEAFTTFEPPDGTDDGVGNVLEDNSGRVWAGVLGSGLYVLDRSVGWLDPVITTENGLPNGNVNGIQQDEDGNLWIATTGGLTKYDPETRQYRNYDASDGLPDIRAWSLSRGSSGRMYVGTKNGLASFVPGLVTDNPYIPPVALTDFKVNDESVAPGKGSPLQEPISVSQHVTLNHDQNHFTLEFAALDYRNSEENNYRYRLKPYDKSWRSVGLDRSATYMNLEPGEYTFTVLGSNDDGVWNQVGRSIQITILPPWWKTWWAYTLLGLAIVLVVLVAHEARVRRLRAHAAELSREVSERTRDLMLEKEKTQKQAVRLLELDKAKNRFFANISHEFRTPLTLILGSVQDTRDEFAERSDGLGKPLQLIQDNADRLLRLVNQLLDLSKLNSGKMKLTKADGDLAGHVREIVQSFVPLAERDKVCLEYRTNLDRLVCRFDRDVVGKVLSNLISNAVKFTSEGGAVVVTLRAIEEIEGGMIEFEVEDSGSGIPESDLSRIFGRFEQGESPATTERGGTGIGLALAKELTELHDGEISVTSQEGRGSRFTVRIPLDRIDEIRRVARPESATSIGQTGGNGHQQPSVEPERETRPDGPGARPSILIVDDNPDLRAYLLKHFESDYEVFEAQNGEDGLGVAQEHVPDLIIADVMMPVMDGFEMCRLLKANDEFRQIPVIMLTAKVDREDAVEGIESGADEYLTKPFSIRELQIRVLRLIETRRELRKTYSREIVVQPAGISITSEDEVFLDKVLCAVAEHLADTAFGVDWLADEVGVSRRKLERKVREVVGEPPAGLIRRLRLERASELLRASAGSVAEISYRVGFGSPAQFNRAFRKLYDESPGEYARNASAAAGD